MTDPKRPDDDTQEFEAADETADKTAEDELEAAEELEADDELEATKSKMTTLELTRTGRRRARDQGASARRSSHARRRSCRNQGQRLRADKQMRTATPAAAVDELPYVDDRVSKIWVGLIVGRFRGDLHLRPAPGTRRHPDDDPLARANGVTPAECLAER